MTSLPACLLMSSSTYLHILAVRGRAAVKAGLRVFLGFVFPFSLDIYPGVECKGCPVLYF